MGNEQGVPSVKRKVCESGPGVFASTGWFRRMSSIVLRTCSRAEALAEAAVQRIASPRKSVASADSMMHRMRRSDDSCRSKTCRVSCLGDLQAGTPCRVCAVTSPGTGRFRRKEAGLELRTRGPLMVRRMIHLMQYADLNLS